MKQMIPPPFTKETKWFIAIAAGVQILAVLYYFNKLATAFTLLMFGIAALIAYLVVPYFSKARTNAELQAKRVRRRLLAPHSLYAHSNHIHGRKSGHKRRKKKTN